MKHYIVAKSNCNGDIIAVNYKKLEGFKVMPKNSKKYPGIEVNSLIIIKPSFIEKIIKKKNQIKLYYYLNYLLSLLDDDDSEENTAMVLGELERYKGVVEYKYRKYLDDKYINILLKKITLLEREIKSKITIKKINNHKTETLDKEELEIRSRRR